PWVVRNGFTAMLALTGAQTALAGVESVIPMDEVVEAMVKIGEAMPRSLKETADGGLAMTPTGCRIRNELYQIRWLARYQRSDARGLGAAPRRRLRRRLRQRPDGRLRVRRQGDRARQPPAAVRREGRRDLLHAVLRRPHGDRHGVPAGPPPVLRGPVVDPRGRAPRVPR